MNSFLFLIIQTSVPKENNDNEDAGVESDSGSTNSSHRSANNNLPTKLLDPMAYLTFDKVRLIPFLGAGPRRVSRKETEGCAIGKE